MQKYIVRVYETTALGQPKPGAVYEWRHEGNAVSDALAAALNRVFALEDDDPAEAMDALGSGNDGFVSYYMGLAGALGWDTGEETQAVLNDPEAMVGLGEAMDEQGPCGWCGTPWSYEVHASGSTGHGVVGPFEIDGVLWAPHLWSPIGRKGLWNKRVRLGYATGWARATSQNGEDMFDVKWDDGGSGLYFPYNVEVLS